jgi:hypothetical protein
MDSSGIQAIIAAARCAPDPCIVLHGVPDGAQKVVEMTRIDKVTDLHFMPRTVGIGLTGLRLSIDLADRRAWT